LNGGQGIVDLVEDNIYLAISVRNAGSGLAVAQGWAVLAHVADAREPHLQPDQFRRQTRDLYIAPNDVGFWQAAIREASDPDYTALRTDIEAMQPFTVEVLYGDLEGGQRTITRFGMIPYRNDGNCWWYPNVALHWNLDRPDPR
jgi:hypothetical protein